MGFLTCERRKSFVDVLCMGSGRRADTLVHLSFLIELKGPLLLLNRSLWGGFDVVLIFIRVVAIALLRLHYLNIGFQD